MLPIKGLDLQQALISLRCKPANTAPASRHARTIDAAAHPPKSEQKFVAKMLDNLLAQHQGQESANAS